MGFEDRLLGNMDRNRERRSELHPVLERGYKKAKSVLENPEYGIQEEEFTSVYGEDMVASDVAKAQRLEDGFNRDRTEKDINSKKISDTLEAIILTQSEMSEWLGNATTLRSSRYDDYVNHVDMIAEWQAPNAGSRVLGLAVDVTFGYETALKKLRAIKAEIDGGKLGSIKYFKDEQANFMGTRYNVPRTIIGVSQPVVQRLAGLWVEGEKRQLGEDPVQRLFTNQMATQLQLMEEYAMKKGKEVAASSYRQALLAVRPLEEMKRSMPLGELEHDPVANEIMLQAHHLFRT